MTLLLQMRDRVTAVRRGQTLVSEPEWPAAIVPPSSTSTADGSPRDLPPYRLRWKVGYQAPPGPLFSVGDRVSGLSVDWEILTPPRPLRDARRVVGYETDVHPLSILFPLNGSLVDQEGNDVAVLPLALWGGSESQEARGKYENMEGETPIDYADALQTRNAVIEVGDDKLRITEVIVNEKIARVRLSLRRPGG